jgi:hypothetical protein
MKKLAYVLVAAMMIGLVSSCKQREKCPAYGKVLPNKHHKEANS